MLSSWGKYYWYPRTKERWAKMSQDQIIYFIDLCLFRSLYSRSSWAKKYWHGVAQELGDKYAS